MGQATSLPDLIKYIHADSFISVQSTWIAKIRKRVFPIMVRPNSRGSPETFTKESGKIMGYLDQTRQNKRSTQPNPDTSADKECGTAINEALHIANTDKTNLIFSVIEKRDAYALTE